VKITANCPLKTANYLKPNILSLAAASRADALK
jgi:hypothetical protein